MRRLVFSALIPLVALLAIAFPADAAIKWCKADPVVRLNGTTVQVLLALPDKYVITDAERADNIPDVNYIAGPARVLIATPKGVKRVLVSKDAGFNGYGEIVTFSDNRSTVTNKQFPTNVRVQVPIDKSKLAEGEVVPMQVTVIPDNAATVVRTGTSDLTTVNLTIIGRT